MARCRVGRDVGSDDLRGGPGANRERRERRNARTVAARARATRVCICARALACFLPVTMTSLLLGSAWGGVMQQAQRGEMQQRASFMPKSELLAWINGLLQTDYAKIEQCANGAAYCQVLDSLFTDEFPLRRVSFKAKAEHESLKNYKLIQEFFMRKGIAKTVDIEKMMKGRPMDNLEFLQWLRGFYDEHQQGPVTYDAASRRKNCGLAVPASSSRLAAGGQRASNVSPRFGSLTSPAYRTKSPMP